jgi:hypothetical protein
MQDSSHLTIILCSNVIKIVISQKQKVNRKNYYYKKLKKKKIVTQSRTGLQIYEGHDDQLNRPGPMA